MISQVIPVVLSPVLTRQYIPAEFGSFAVFISIISLLSVVAAGRYPLAVMVEEDVEQRQLLFCGALLICALFSVIVLLSCIIVAFFLKDCFLSSAQHRMAIALGCFLLGANQLLGYWFNKSNNLKLVSKSKAVQGVCTGLATVALGIWSKGYVNGLIWGYVLGLLCANLIFWSPLTLALRNFQFSWKRLRVVLVKYKEYPLYSTPGAFMDTVALQLPTLVLSYIFDKTIVGYWGFTVRLIQVPSGLISFSLSQVLFQRFTAVSDMARLRTDASRILYGLLLLFAPFALMILVWGPSVFSFLFGSTWSVSGHYAQIQILAFAVKFAVSPLSIVFSAVNKVKLGARWQLTYFTTTMLWIGIAVFQRFNITAFLVIYSIHEILVYIHYYILMRKALT